MAGIEGIEDKTVIQVCLVVHDVEKMAANYARIFGFETPKEYVFTELYAQTQAEYYGKPTDARAKITLFPMGNVVLELLQPLDAPSTWMDHLKQHGESIHHVAFGVTRTALAAAAFADHGYKVTQQGLIATQRELFNGLFKGRVGEYTYLDTDKDMGIVIELLEFYDPALMATYAESHRAGDGFGSDVICQVGLIVSDIDHTTARYREVLGVAETMRIETPGYDVTETTFKGEPTEATAKLAFYDFGQLQLELIEPDTIPSVWRNHLNDKGDSAHHIAFQVQDTARAVGHFAKHGIGVVQQGLYGDRSGMYTYLDSEVSLGVSFELLESFDKPR